MTPMSGPSPLRSAALNDATPWDAARSPAGTIGRHDVRLLAVLASGAPLNTIARRIGVSDRTVRRRLRRLCDSIQVQTPIEAVAWAARRRLI